MLTFLLTLLLILFAVMTVPVDLNFTIQRDIKFQGSASTGWLFGLVRIPLQSGKAKTRDARKSKHKKNVRSHHKPKGWHVGAMLGSQGFLSRLIRVMNRLRACIHIRQLRLMVRLGLDDPADTGRLWGIVGPLTLTIPVPARADVAIQPEFSGAIFQVDGEGALRIVPIEIIGILIGFAFSPVTLRALYALGTGR